MQRKDGLMVIGAAVGDVTVMPAPKNLPSSGSTVQISLAMLNTAQPLGQPA